MDCYAPRILGWCRRFGLQEADAADAAQMVLLKLVDQLKGFEYDEKRGRFRAWLKTLTRNIAIDVHRKWGARARDGLAADIQLEEIADHALNPAEGLFQAIEAGWRDDILRLAETRVQLLVQPETWQVYWLCCRERKRVAEVAESLKLTVSNVYVSKSRVLKLLRGEIQRLDPDGNCDG